MTRSKNWPKIVFGLILIFAAQIACDVSGKDPKDEALQDPAVNLMNNFNRLLENIGFAGTSGAPWIVQISPKSVDIPGTYLVTGEAFYNGDIGLYAMQPQGCGKPFSATKLLTNVKTEETSPGFSWRVDPIDIPTGTVLGAVEIYDPGSKSTTTTAFSSLRLVGSSPDWELRLLPPASTPTKTTYTTLYGQAKAGLCVQLWKGSQKVAEAAAGSDGMLTFADVKIENGPNTFYLKAVGIEIADNTPLQSEAVRVDAYQPPKPYDPSQRPDLSGNPNMTNIWNQIYNAPVQNTPDTRTPESYIAIIEQFDPGSRRYKRYGDGVHSSCNIFAGDVMRAMNIPLPTKKDLGNVDGGGPTTIAFPRLNNWIRSQAGRDAGWIAIDKNNNDDLYKLLQHLREGKPALAVDNGHVAVLRPDSLPDNLTTANITDLHIAQAGGINGGNNSNDIQLKKAGYGSAFNPDFFIHP